MKSNIVRFGQSIEKTIMLLPKRICVVMIIGISFLFCQFPSTAQEQSAEIKVESITSLPLFVGYNKTSNLIFPYAIKSVDRGSKDLLVQKAKGVESILQVKAGKEGFAETNLSVITADGQFYSFLVNYEANPIRLNLSFGKDSTATPSNTLLSGIPINEAALESAVENVKETDHFLHLQTSEQKIRVSVSGIYLKEKIMLFSLVLRNRSLIDYTPDYIRFFIRQKKLAKRTAIQEKEVQPIYAQSDFTITGRQECQQVFAFCPFTISKAQELVIEIGEKNGGRSLLLRVSGRALLKARLL